MSRESSSPDRPAWRLGLPVLSGQTVALREPARHDLAQLIDLLATEDAPALGLDDEVSEDAVGRWIERVHDDRSRGFAFTYVVSIGGGQHLVGILQVRALDPLFEAGEWDGLLLPSVRGTNVFLEMARLVGSFAFTQVGTHRLECRVLLQNGRANGALRKLGASQEGLLRRSVRRDSQYFDQVLWSILKDDWVSQWLPVASRVH